MVNVLLGYGSCIHTHDQSRLVLRSSRLTARQQLENLCPQQISGSPVHPHTPECAGRLPNGPALQTQLPHPLIIIYRDNPAHPIYGTSELPCHKEILDEFDNFFCEVENEQGIYMIGICSCRALLCQFGITNHQIQRANYHSPSVAAEPCSA